MTNDGYPSHWNRIIIFRPGQFGDTLVAFPVIEGLRRLFPSTPIMYCTNRYRSRSIVLSEETVGLCPSVDGVATYFVEDGPFKRWRDLRAQLQIRDTDLFIYLPEGLVKPVRVLRDWVFFQTFGLCRAIGFRETLRWSLLWARSKAPLPKEADRLLDVVRSAGLPVKAPTRCAVNTDETWAIQQWKKWGLDGQCVLAVCPGSKMQSKRWPADRFVSVGYEWHRRTGAALVIVGGPEESNLALEMVQQWKGYGFSACGATLAQTAAVLCRASAFLGNDTGGMHLAAIMGVRCVALFSSREPACLWFPYGEGHVVLRNDMPCANCGLQTCYADPPVCLELTQADRVLNGLAQVWEQGRTLSGHFNVKGGRRTELVDL